MKKQLRQQLRELKKTISEERKLEAERNITKILLENESVRRCRSIAAYWSLPDELPTHNLIAALVAEGHDVYLPHIVGKDLFFYKYVGAEFLTAEKSYGIGEPTEQQPLDESQPFCALIPGVAFTSDGRRLGRGAGFYDRWLARCSSVTKIGIAMHEQKLTDIPVDEHDVVMDVVIFA